MTLRNVGRYIIRQPLGQGGMATVYRALDPRFQREVAVKVLPRELVSKATFRARFDREARIIASLEHPAIVPVYDFGEHEGVPYLVMRLMTGGSLADRLADGALPLPQAVAIIKQLAGALDEAHARGIVHRDLKPGNILFDNRHNPHLADFGIVKIAQENTASLTRTGGIIGTPAYMSPEQVMGRDELDGRSDIYALGIIFFEMLTGDLPYKADTPMGIAMQHVSEPIPKLHRFRADLPPACEPIIATVLAKERGERYQTAVAFADSIDILLPAASPTPPQTELLDGLVESDAELTLYDEALQAQQRGDWDTAIARLTALISKNPSFRDAAHQLGHAYRQKQFAIQLAQAAEAAANEAWDDVITLAGRLVNDDPENSAAHELLRQAQRQRRLANAYDSAREALQAAQWEPALEKLESILETAPDYLDAAQLLAEAESGYRQARHRARLFAQGTQALQERLPEAAKQFFDELAALDPDYPELTAQQVQADTLLARQRQAAQLLEMAREHAAAEEWEAALTAAQQAVDLDPENRTYQNYAKELRESEARHRSYQEAQAALAAENWAAAAALLEPIQTQQPDYKDVARLLADVRGKQELQAEAEALYARAAAAAENEAWETAVSLFTQVTALIPDYRDAQSQIVQLNRLLDEAQKRQWRVEKAARQYASAAAALKTGEYQQAIAAFRTLLAANPQYKDAADLLNKAEQAEKAAIAVAELYELGNSALKSGEWTAAVDAFRQLLDAHPGYRDAAARLEQAEDKIAQEELKERKQQSAPVTADAAGEEKEQEPLAPLAPVTEDFTPAPPTALDTVVEPPDSNTAPAPVAAPTAQQLNYTEVIAPPTSSPESRSIKIGGTAVLVIVLFVLIGGSLLFFLLNGSAARETGANNPNEAVAALVEDGTATVSTADSTATAVDSTEAMVVDDAKQTPTTEHTPTAEPSPTSSPTPTISPTPTQTLTPSPVPTPLGGGSGHLVYFDDFGLYRESIVSRERIPLIETETLQELLGVSNSAEDPRGRGYLLPNASISPDGEKFWLGVCLETQPGSCPINRLFVGTLDLTRVEEIVITDPQDIYSISWAPNSEWLLVQTIINRTIEAGGLPTYVVSLQPDSFGAVDRVLNSRVRPFWSADSERIYYVEPYAGWQVMSRLGGKIGALPCAACPTNESPLGGTASPDGQSLILVYRDGTFIITDVDFTNERTLAAGATLDLVWSPDGSEIIADYGGGLNQISAAGAVRVIREFDSNAATRAFSSCGWSPDGSQFLFIASIAGENGTISTTKDIVALNPINEDTEIISRITASYLYSCPMWVSSLE